MSDTPETDAAWKEGNAIREWTCRKLERERDDAMEEIKEWKTLCLWGGTPEHIHGFIRGQQSRIQHLECERDEAMELLASEKITRNHIIKRSVEVEQERDEAREAFVIATDQMVIAQGKVREANKERDEAREKYATEATEHMLAVNKICNERDEARNLACVYQHQYYIHVHPNTIPPYFSWQRQPEPM